MWERVESLKQELRDVETRLLDPRVQADASQLAILGRRFKQLEEIVSAGMRWRATADDLETANEMLRDAQSSERDEMRAEITELETQLNQHAEALRNLMVPSDPNAGRNVIIEIRGAAGGDEANLFARDLLVMYEAFAKRMGWKMELLSVSATELGGLTEVTALVAGATVWTRMKHEAGTHRVQRVPVTESQGRVHTSSATVIVLPEPEEVEVEIEDNDLRIDTYRASGHGGQSVNTMDSAVRIVHEPTGIVVTMQDEKSQLKNKNKAMRVLRARLAQLAADQAEEQAANMRKGQVSRGDRSEKIRTYNYKENRLTDHRIGFTVHKLDRVLAGDLDDLSDALVAEERQRQLQDG